ncbi:MAG: helix-turn-helix domain-containing protein [Verrucomicrobia bacterium]|nr:helix-turn-helix domain-containing protein [Verrucomicrobiota bacterium]
MNAAAPLMTRQQAAAALGVSLRTIDSLTGTGDLPAIHIRRAVRYRPSAIEFFCDAHESRRNPRTAKRKATA